MISQFEQARLLNDLLKKALVALKPFKQLEQK